MIKVLHIIHGLNKGGAERQLSYLLKNIIDNKEIETELLLLSDDINYKEVLEIPLQIYTLKRKVKKDVALIPKIHRLLKEKRPDIVHIWDSMSSLYVTYLARLKKIKIVNGSIRYAFKAKPFSQFWLSNKLTLPSASKIVANTKFSININNLNNGKSEVIYNGYDFSRNKDNLNIEVIKKKYGIETLYSVTMVANFTKYKDYNTFFRAAEKIIDKRNDVTFIAVGRFDKNFLDEKILTFINNNNKIKITGEIDNVDELIYVSDIGVLCSNLTGEGISNTLMEFMAYRKPIIATDSQGTKELLDDNDDACIIPFAGVDELVSKINFLLENQDIRIKLGEKAYIKLKNKFSIDRMVNDFIKLYKEVI